jgi:hypothetical protein
MRRKANLLCNQERVGFCCFGMVTVHSESYPLNGHVKSLDDTSLSCRMLRREVT